jgi:hypothetical protein
MKRFLNLLLVMLLIASVAGTASAGQRKKKHPKPQPEVELEAVPAAGAAKPVQGIKPAKKGVEALGDGDEVISPPSNGHGTPFGKPVEQRLTRADSRRFDLRSLPLVPVSKFERPEHEEPNVTRSELTANGTGAPPQISGPSVPPRNAPAPPTNIDFAGLDFATWGAGHPPDTVGDVGPTVYIQSINSSIGVFRKSDGVQLAAFTLNTFMQQGNFGNLCDTNNFGDPVILYDSFEDRWIITDFAFQLSGGNVVNPPGAFQCVAASLTGDPVSGGWTFYSINTQFGLGDYPKFGIWPDGLYMTASIFGYPSGAAFQNARAYAFNKQQMYAAAPSVQVVSFNILGGDFTILPSNARLQSGTPPPGTPNYYLSTWLFLNAVTVYKFHVDWNNISLSTFTGPDTPIAASSWPNAAVPNALSLGGNALDVLQIRAMMQNQYTNIGGAESLWATHTVRRQNTSGLAAPRWYQVDVTGGTVNANIPQATTWDPDGANVISRFMPSLAVDRVGDLALGYSTSSSSTKPAIKYAGRLFNDPINSFSLTEQLMTQGAGTQVGNCGASTCIRWGDYSAMTLDPDGCRFWYTNMYYAVDGLNHQTRIGSFGPFPGCTPVGAGGTLSGTVTATAGGAPIPGANIQFGSRTATTNGSGFYSFSVPAGNYLNVTASKPGFVPSSSAPIAITDGNTTTQNFSLANAPTSSCIVETTQADWQTGTPTGVDLVVSAGSAVLSNGDPQNSLITTSGVGITTTTWGGQTFTPLGSGNVTKIDINLFCSACSGTPQNLTVGIRATSGGLPTGADLATATIPGFILGSAVYYSANFSPSVPLTGGTMYAFVIHPNVNPTGTYALTRSGTDVYSGGTRVSGATSGTVWSIPLTTTMTTDAGFRVWMGEVLSAGNLVSSVKDANPSGGITPIWGTFSWNATTPANTGVKFQIAASNSPSGPFSFVGPDGTAATFFTTSPFSLSQFYNLRYLQYKAFLSTTDNNVSPSLDDVSICFADVDCSGTPPITPTPAQVCANSTGNTASGPAGATSYSWSITNGSITGGGTTQTVTYTAGASGNVGLVLNIVLPNGCHQSNSINVPINLIPPQPTITPSGPTTFCAGGSVTLTSSSTSGNQWYQDGNPIGGETNQTYLATTSGNYTVIVTSFGCSSPPSAATSVTVNPNPPTPTINNSGPTTFCTGGSVTLTSDAPSGNQWKLNGNPIGGATNTTYIATASGSYTVTVTDGNNCSATSAPTVVQVDTMPTTPTISADTNGTGTQDQACPEQPLTLHANGATGATSYQWYQDNNTLNGQTASTYQATGVGTYYVTALNGTCTTPQSAGYVVQNPTPHSPFISAAGPTTFCQGGSVQLQSNSATGIQWYRDTGSGRVIIAGANSQNYTATVSGTYTAQLNALGCHSQFGNDVVVTVNPLPATPTINAGGPTTFCQGGSVTLTSSSGTGNQWYLNGNPIGGATNNTYSATASGSYTVKVTDGNNCTSAASSAIVVTVNPLPATPTITPGGPTTFCTGGSVTLTSSSGTGNQWYLNGNPIGGATNNTYIANASGSYTVRVTDGNNCTSAASAPTTVTVNPFPNATITAPPSMTAGTAGSASVANAGAGATYNWSVTNGAINSGQGTNALNFTAGSAGTLTLNVTVTLNGCSDAKSKNVNVISAVTVTSITPATGSTFGGQPVTIGGTGFVSGATVKIGGNAATNVVFVNSTTIKAKTPAHAGGTVNVVVTNPDTGTGTLTNGYTYVPQKFDPNNDGVIDAADVFYLINYLFLGGPAPIGPGGMPSGDANGDLVVDPADIFYVVHYVFDGGPAPATPQSDPRVAATSAAAPIAGSITLGDPIRRAGGTFVPLIVSIPRGADVPRALSVKVRAGDGVSTVAIRRAEGAAAVKPVFESSQRTADGIAYLVSFSQGLSFTTAANGVRSAVVAEVEVQGNGKIDLDPALTMLSDGSGMRNATRANGRLELGGTRVRTPRNE